MGRLLLVLALVFLCTSFAAAQSNYYQKENLSLSLEISNEINVVTSSSDYDIQNLKVYLSFVPIEDARQEILSINTVPETKEYEKGRLFHWEAVDTKKLAYKLKSDLVTKNKIPQIKDSPGFPLNERYKKQYLVETESVDFKDEDIRNLASSIASGHDNEYEVVHALADWVNENIQYSLETKTSSASKKASWVLENRRGVCDELTNLFIGLCRSMDIPARFVSGVSYTSDERFDSRWSSHGWAEVYFPGYGWVPFDVTYGQFGYIDPAHIKLKVADDANKSSTKYSWQAKSATIETGQLALETRVKDMGQKVEPLLDINARVAKEEIDFGSYNVYEVTINNPHNYYVPTELMLSKTKNLEMFGGYSHNILMKPKEKRTFFYIFRISKALSEDYRYTFKINARSYRNATDKDVFEAGSDYPEYSLKEIREYVSAERKEENKSYSKNVTFECGAKENYIVTEVAGINCTIKNTGNTALDDLNICMEECLSKDLGISQQKHVRFNYAINSAGKKKLYLRLEHKNISKQSEVIFDAYHRPRLNITDINYPEEVSLEEPFNISFLIKRANNAPVKDLDVKVFGSGINQKWQDNDIESESKKFIVNVDKRVLVQKDNSIHINAGYMDDRNREFNLKKSFSVKVSDATASQRVMLFINKLQWDIENNIVNAIIIAIGSIIVAVLVLIWLFRPPEKGRL